MRDVWETVLQDKAEQQERIDALTDEQRAERFDANEYIERVRVAAKAEFAHLPRVTRRREVYAAIQRAKKRGR